MTRLPLAALLLLALQDPVPAPPAGLGLAAFYKKYVDAGGLPIVGSEKVPDAALVEARTIVLQMTSKRPDAVAAMKELKTRVSLMAKTEVTTDIPEHSDLNTAFPRTDWNKRCRGVGATVARPACSATEENLLQLDGDRYAGESILIHEFGHTMLVMGMTRIDRGFKADIDAAYKDAMAKGLFRNTYAASNADEYWAEGAQDWFDANLTSTPSNGIHNEIGTRAALKSYDPALAALLAKVFGDDAWRWQPKKRK
ncbi:MAG TPA: hypothetical protein VE981_00965 [Planctomycetota bacterium]|nr:hypothetical protein [Planctomycetota bacterium]